MAERFKAALLKSAELKDSVGSNPTLSASRTGLAPSRDERESTAYAAAVTERPSNSPRGEPSPGLCGGCRFSRRIETRRGSAFRLCERSATEPAYPRYPALPVLRCAGFEPVTEAR